MAGRLTKDTEILAIMLAVTLGPASYDAIFDFLKSSQKDSELGHILRKWRDSYDDRPLIQILENAIFEAEDEIHPALRYLLKNIIDRDVSFRFKGEYYPRNFINWTEDRLRSIGKEVSNLSKTTEFLAPQKIESFLDNRINQLKFETNISFQKLEDKLNKKVSILGNDFFNFQWRQIIGVEEKAV